MEAIYRIYMDKNLTLEDNTIDFDVTKNSGVATCENKLFS